jgi:hypothetical protein
VFRKAIEDGGNRGSSDPQDSAVRMTTVAPIWRGERLGYSAFRFGGVVAMAYLALFIGLAGQSAGQAVDSAGVIEAGQSAEATPPVLIDPGDVSHIYQLKPITTLRADIRPQQGKLPKDHTASAFSTHVEGTGHPSESAGPWKPFLWEAPATCHRPLYFENVNLERHGYSFGVAQPFVSAGHFACSTVILPYRMAAEPRCEPIYTLGHVRPGTPTPFQIHWPPPSTAAGLAEAALIVGLICLIP